MNGAILGMTKAEIASKLDEIVDFSGCERYLDTPVKRYSSGMMVRLGFAVAAHLDPEILVVDEVLAVGDAEFQKKAIGKMQDVSKGEGRTVLFVSHNMGSIRQLCKSGVLLENGMIKTKGKIEDVLDVYLSNEVNKENIFIPSNNVVKRITAESNRDSYVFSMEYDSDMIIRQPVMGFVVYDKNGMPLFGTNTIKDNVVNYPSCKKGVIECQVSSPTLVEGEYPVSFWFDDGPSNGNHILYAEHCLMLRIEDNTSKMYVNPRTTGHVIADSKWQFKI